MLAVRCAYFSCGELTDSPDERGLCPICSVQTACAHCGMPNAAAKRSTICPACQYEERDPKRAERQAQRELMTELGMPDDAIWKRIVYRGAWFDELWAPYSVDMFGMSVDHMPNPCPWPFWRMFAPGGSGAITVQIWRQEIRCGAIPAFVEARWHPERGETIGMIGLERVTSIRDAQKALRGLKLLRLLDQRGRKAGREIPPDQFNTELIKAYKQVLARLGHRPTQYDVAAEMGMGRSTLTDYLRDYKEFGIGWPPKVT